jgi:regulator of cell morphogenesis and NO signaling
LTQLANYIVSTHHDFIKREAPQIAAYLEKIASKHGDRHPELPGIAKLFTSVREEMDEHMNKEEMILFPRIKSMEENNKSEQAGSRVNRSFLSTPIHMMEEEHDHAGKLMGEIRLLTHDYTPPQDACTTYKLAFASLRAFEMDLHQHVHLENNILFPKALQLFTGPDQCSLN